MGSRVDGIVPLTMAQVSPLVVVADGPAWQATAARLAAELALPLAASIDAQACALVAGAEGLALQRGDGTRLTIDFRQGKTARRLDEPGLRRQPLARALGIGTFDRHQARRLRITDATAGFGQDAWFAAGCGAELTMIERLPWLHRLLQQAIADALDDPVATPVASRMTLVLADACDYCMAHPDAADVVYLDPMYPPRRKSAQVGKGMQLLHVLAGPADDSAALFDAALRHARYRVVVKRPRGASPIAGAEVFTGQVTTVQSPNTRYDIYHRRALSS